MLTNRTFSRWLKWSFCLSILNGSTVAVSDIYHYNNIIVGDRAMGLGGAYTAISDDASGLFYNPAGLAFALSNDISGSAQAFFNRKVVYKKTIAGQDFEELSNGAVPVFLGGLQKMDKQARGLVAAFSIFSSVNEKKNQNDLLDKATPLSSNVMLNRFHRTVIQNSSSINYAVGAGYRITSTFSVGLSVVVQQLEELVQEYQDVNTTSVVDVNGSNDIDIKQQNVRTELKVQSLIPTLGLQWAIGRFSLGASVRQGRIMSEEFNFAVDRRNYTFRQVLDGNGNAGTRTYVDGCNPAYDPTLRCPAIGHVKVEKPFEKLPLEARLGVALFATTRLIWSLDAAYHGGVERTGSAAQFHLEPVTDYSTGLEYYVMPQLPARFGLFTNNDARKNVEKGKSGQLDHIDYKGASVFLAWVLPNSQVQVGIVQQQGTGKSQKALGTQIQEVEASMSTFAFSATHSF